MKRIAAIVLLALLICPSYAIGRGSLYWHSVAEKMSTALIDHFWGASFDGQSSRYYFNYLSDEADMTTVHYWPEAHAMDVIIDAYCRSGNLRYLSLYPLWWVGVPNFNYSGRKDDPWWNPYVDDMEWIVLTQIRMYESTGNRTYLSKAVQMYNDWIWPTWGPEDEAPWFGGLTWCTDRRKSKNACSNGPAAIIAAKLSRHVAKEGLQPEKDSAQYLAESEKIYFFERRVLFDTLTGAVHDNINLSGRISPAIFTYNQGTFIGAAVELFKQTGDRRYLKDAVLAADYAIDSMTMRDAPGGDGGLFNGIFFRYLASLALCPEIDGSKYSGFLLSQGDILVDEALGENALFAGRWHQKPEAGQPVSLTSHLTGCMLAEAICLILTHQ